jgi:multidrug transporter EmrE-like cation transporter
MTGIVKSIFQVTAAQRNAIIVALILGNFAFNVIANTCFKISTNSPNMRVFLFWQVIGNITGFLVVVTITGLLHYVPLHIAFPLTTGLAVIGLQVVSNMMFRETIPSIRWVGTFFVLVGIVLLSR